VSDLTGDNLEDAFVSTDEYGKPEVSFRFSVEGRRLFAEVTERAAGGFIAIVLDDVIKSAPSVKEKIDSDRARITLGSQSYAQAFDEAQFIATSLRAGALPAALEQLEERTVGPTLGADAIRKGQKGAVVGTILVLGFILVYYGILGFIAAIAILLNLLFVFGALTSLGATLTLPGVAGLALTVGMAVDANIIIYERIREELQKGSSQLAAMRDGFGNAFSAIVDSNVTTILTCFILMYYGTGPVRGFAVSLAIGIIASMFTSIFVARTIAETLVQKFQVRLMKEKAV
jgi:preprotein translocase subunit SecD